MNTRTKYLFGTSKAVDWERQEDINVFKQWKRNEVIGYGIFLIVASILFFFLFPQLKQSDARPLILTVLNDLGGRWLVCSFFFVAGLLVLI